MQNKNEFTQQRIVELLSGLHDDSKPLWGMMTPQHVTEHLTLSVKSSIGRTRPIVVTPPDQIETLKRQWLYNNDLWPQGMKNPLLPTDKLPDLKYDTLEEAKENLIIAVGEYERYYVANPDAIQPNPFLGHMNHDEWQQFHFKHFRHHFIQYGLLNNPYKA